MKRFTAKAALIALFSFTAVTSAHAGGEAYRPAAAPEADMRKALAYGIPDVECEETLEIMRLENELEFAKSQSNDARVGAISAQLDALRIAEEECLNGLASNDLGDIAPAAGSQNNPGEFGQRFARDIPRENPNQLSAN